MRIETHGSNIVISPELEKHTERCIWLAAQRHRQRISWVGVQFTEHRGEGEPLRTLCQIDLWLHKAGLITIRHTDTNPYVAVDLAAARLRQVLRSAPKDPAESRPEQEAAESEAIPVDS